MSLLMNVVVTTLISINNVPTVTSVTFESTDERDCSRTARAVLGNAAMKEGVEWFVVKDLRGNASMRKTVVCVPRHSSDADE